MKQDPKNVYILENGSYTEITYEQFCQIRSTDEKYKKKHRFLRLHGVLMEVTDKDYKIFYETRRRQKYLKERSEEKQGIFLETLAQEKYNDEFIGKMVISSENELKYIGIAICGNKKQINKLTSSLPLLR